MTGVPTTMRLRGILLSLARWPQIRAMFAPADTPPREIRVGSILNFWAPWE